MAATGCDSRELLGPATRTAVPRAGVDVPVSLGSGFVPAPPNSSPTAIANPPYVELASFPGATWIVVSVTGNVGLAWNDEPCAQRAIDAPFWPCQDGSPLSAFGSEPWDGGPLALRATYTDGDNGAVKLRSTGAGGGGGSAVGLYYASKPGSLSGHVNMTAQWAWDPTFGNGPYSWKVSGGYTVSATAVPSPFQVTESAPDASGVVTYTVEPLYGLQLTTPVNGWPDGATFWAFYPGDSLPDQPDRGWPGWTIAECQFQLVCRYKPPQAGRVQVLAHLERQPAYARSKPAKEGECIASSNLRATCLPADPQVQVVCSPVYGSSLVRGDTVDCVTTVTPAQPFTVKIRQASGDGFAVADTPNAQFAAGAADHWRGLAVADSRVKVSVEVVITGQVRVLDQQVRYTVTPRQWQVYRITNPTVVYGLVPGGAMSPAPDSLHHTYGAFDLTNFRTDSATITVVDTGPNQGLAFYPVQIPFDEGGAYVWIHPAIFPPSAHRYAANSDYERWYNDQNGQGTGTCTSAGIAVLAIESPRHEGATLADSSHLGVANRFFANDRLDRRFEELYRVGAERLRRDASRLYTRWKAGTYRRRQNDFDVADRPRVWARVGCTLDLFVNDAH